jgi:hypothetical protein
MSNAIDRWLAVVASVAFAACGSSGSGTPGDDEPGNDAPASGGGFGSLLIEQATLFGTPFTIEGGSFSEGSRPAATERTDGPCVITTGAPAAKPKVDAGGLEIAGGASPISLVPEADNDYFASQSALHFAPGAAIGIVGSGGIVPAFSGATTFPAQITVMNPASPIGFTLSKGGFSASWTTTGTVLLLIGQSPAAVISCRFSGVSSGTVPASALADLVVGEDDTTVIIGTESKTSIDAGGFALEVQVINAGFFGMATVQP